MFNDFEEFEKVLVSNRDSGDVTCRMKDINQVGRVVEVKEQFLQEVGLNSDRIKGRWKEVDRKTAGRILEYILSVDMAYDIKLKSKPLADQLGRYFLNQFHFDAKYYTNGDFEEKTGFLRIRGWIPVTASTFDTGVVVMDEDRIGILWTEDDD
ncbi:hypothetical protein [Ammoniphilus resinae]|uniref:tRNA uridine 5-carbamoylmethylation protein Kti12 n=1 Tax=Ammoniphilus resinae TaxID=861532 RepID=A0ABS4GRW6_9BACL|nr:hypothetical protein [Ammoniphilus resinae]MBP1933011.1 tRNA uridine 5-carbamoylmethylation protein Kti12 [Ammoniphilus resinae]